MGSKESGNSGHPLIGVFRFFPFTQNVRNPRDFSRLYPPMDFDMCIHIYGSGLLLRVALLGILFLLSEKRKKKKKEKEKEIEKEKGLLAGFQDFFSLYC